MSTATGLAPLRAFRSLLSQEPAFTLQQRLNRLFEEAFGPLALLAEEPLSITAWTPSCDVYETDNEIVVKAEIPGMKKEDVKVSIEDNLLTLSGERKFEEETKRENYRRIERSYGAFTRSFTLPPSVDTKKVTAEFKDGLLEVKLPKLEAAKPKQVEIKVK
jgi:HSP20 family protein